MASIRTRTGLDGSINYSNSVKDRRMRLVVDGVCANCGKAIRETSPWQWTHYVGEYYCNGRDITSRDYAHPDRETIARAQELRRG